MSRDQLTEYLLSHLRLFHELKMKTGTLNATPAELEEFIASERVRFGTMTTQQLQHIYWRNYVHEDFFDGLSNASVPESCPVA